MRFEFWAVALAVWAAAALLRYRRSRFAAKLSPQCGWSDCFTLVKLTGRKVGIF